MKKSIHSKERGQALVIIALAAIGLFAFAALAIDGSMVFSDRRHAQNAADTAALEAALTRVRGGSWESEGLNRASSNGYANDADSTVELYLCDNPLATCEGLPADAIPEEYIQVKITSDVKMLFARVIGRQVTTNRVQAVARAVKGKTKPMFDGHAVVGLAPHDCKAVKYQGNAGTTVTGSGIFVNSDCPSAAFFNNSSAAKLKAPCLQSVGGIQYAADALDIPTSCFTDGAAAYNYPPDNIVFPNIICPSGESSSGSTLNPGTYTSGNKFPPSGITSLSPGVYCVENDFVVNGGESLNGSNVIIIMKNGDVSFNGGATINLSGPEGPQSETNPYGGLFMYMPMENQGTISINGNSGSGFTGSILAPAADITIDGTGDGGFEGQIIGYTVDLSGTSTVKINYDDSKNWDAPVPPQVEFKH